MPKFGKPPQPLEGVPRLLNVAQACQALGISAQTFYRCVARGEVRIVKVGGCTRVPVNQAVFGVSESAAQ